MDNYQVFYEELRAAVMGPGVHRKQHSPQEVVAIANSQRNASLPTKDYPKGPAIGWHKVKYYDDAWTVGHWGGTDWKIDGRIYPAVTHIGERVLLPGEER